MTIRTRAILAAAALAALGACADQTTTDAALLRPQAQEQAAAPAMRWGGRKDGEAWRADLLAALKAEGVALTSTVPHDVATFCPGYPAAGPETRRAFWAGLLSAVARHESTFNPGARGGGGRWLGLMQIAPGTWRSYGCTGSILDGGDNLACAARIAARQVVRDNAIVGGKGGWRGVARDWAPMRSGAKRADIAAWTRSQSYCAPQSGGA